MDDIRLEFADFLDETRHGDGVAGVRIAMNRAAGYAEAQSALYS